MDLLVGYGSLMNPSHRQKVGLDASAEPVRLRGYQRRWNVQAANKRTYLGVLPSSSSWLNAVLVPLPEERSCELDGRESAYDRVRVPNATISLALPLEAACWLYVPRPEWVFDQASHTCAVKRGYVDLVVEGCLSYGFAFAEEFFVTTLGWSQHWYDNRQEHHPLRSQIDHLTDRYYPVSRRVGP